MYPLIQLCAIAKNWLEELYLCIIMYNYCNKIYDYFYGECGLTMYENVFAFQEFDSRDSERIFVFFPEDPNEPTVDEWVSPLDRCKWPSAVITLDKVKSHVPDLVSFTHTHEMVIRRGHWPAETHFSVVTRKALLPSKTMFVHINKFLVFLIVITFGTS